MDFENQEVENIETNLGTEDREIVSEDSPEVSEYQPNYKFKVDEKEFEFDERVRPLVTDKDSEAYFRDLYTKAHGLDIVKTRAEETKKKYQETSQQHGDLRNQFDHVQNTLTKLNRLKSEDFGTFQKVWEVPDRQILARASEILRYHDDPDAAAAADKVYSDRIEMMKYEDRVNRETQTSSAVQRQLHEMKFERAMSQPDISRFAQEYDRRMGQAGSFQEEVNRLGTIEFHAGRYLDPQVAVGQAFQRLSRLIGPLSDAQASASTPSQSQSQAAPKPALPNMGSGRSGSAVAKRPRSIADLRKLAQSME